MSMNSLKKNINFANVDINISNVEDSDKIQQRLSAPTKAMIFKTELRKLKSNPNQLSKDELVLDDKLRREILNTQDYNL